MARVLRELLRRQSSNRFITTLTHHNPSNLGPPLSLLQPNLTQSKFDFGRVLNPSNEGLTATDEITQFPKLQIYTSFSFGSFLNPILPSGSGLSLLIRPEGVDLEHSGMMWADSVKKKRKRKMNKHKYKKLRKRLRRKTKT